MAEENRWEENSCVCSGGKRGSIWESSTVASVSYTNDLFVNEFHNDLISLLID